LYCSCFHSVALFPFALDVALNRSQNFCRQVTLEQRELLETAKKLQTFKRSGIVTYTLSETPRNLSTPEVTTRNISNLRLVSPLPEHLKNQIEELHQSHTNRDINRNFQP